MSASGKTLQSRLSGKPIRLLVDGYNLLHATDLFGDDDARDALRGSRQALLDYLVHRLTPGERQATLIVFDATEAPPGLPDTIDHAGIEVRFARDYADADGMIEDLLDGLHRARHLTVVSGDHRIQRAARASGAKWIDSDQWFHALSRQDPISADEEHLEEPAGSPSDWIAEFSDPAKLVEIEREAAGAPPPVPTPPKPTSSKPLPAAKPKSSKPPRRKRRPPLSESTEKPSADFGVGVFDPFPPGYAEDLVDPDEKN